MTTVVFLFVLLIVKNYIKGPVNISAHLSMKITLMDPNLERTFFGNNFFDPNYDAHL